MFELAKLFTVHDIHPLYMVLLGAELCMSRVHSKLVLHAPVAS